MTNGLDVVFGWIPQPILLIVIFLLISWGLYNIIEEAFSNAIRETIGETLEDILKELKKTPR